MIGNGSGSNTGTMNGCGTTVLSAGFGVMLETTSTLHTYNFHRLQPKATEVTTVAAISSDVTTVAGISSDIEACADNESNIDTVGGAIANVNAVGSSIANVNTVATNLTSVNDFAARYRVSSSAPTSSLDVGDLWFDSSSNTMKVYSASGFQNAVSSVNGTISYKDVPHSLSFG